MNLMTLINEIGTDADLLTRSDQWLEEERKSVAAQVEEFAKELYAITLAQKIKRQLQQRNLVAVQSLERAEDGDINNIKVEIVTLKEGIKKLTEANTDTLDSINLASHLVGWNNDGYDIKTTNALNITK